MSYKVLLFGFCPKNYAATCRDHFFAFKRYSKFQVHEVSNLGGFPPWIRLEDFDVLVIHYTIYTIMEHYLMPETVEKIRNFKGIRVLYIQDEYRRINQIKDKMRELKIDLLFTCVPEEEIEKVYFDVPAKKINVLTGYVPEKLAKTRSPQVHGRSIGVGYRARKLSAWYGALAQEKWQIVDSFKANFPAHAKAKYSLDLSYHEEERLYGAKWDRFLKDCRTVLGVESGASVFDFTGEIELEIEAYERSHPNATFEEIRDKFLTDIDGKIRLNQISPRCFEAACLRTPMILFEGDYSGVLKPWRHYIPLKKDFSNIDEVCAKIDDTEFLQKMADITYDEVALNPEFSFRAMIEKFDREVEAFAREKSLAPVTSVLTHKMRVRSALHNEWHAGGFKITKRLVKLPRQTYRRLMWLIRVTVWQIPGVSWLYHLTLDPFVHAYKVRRSSRRQQS